MEQLSNKATNGTLAAQEWNQVASEIENPIQAFGYILDPGDLNQLGQAMAAYSGSSDFYSDSGPQNAPVLNSLGGRQAPQAQNANHDGLRARFRPAVNNNGACTVNVNGIGVVDLVAEDGAALVGGELITTQDAEIRWDNGNTRYILLAGSVATEASVVPPRGYIDGMEALWVAGGTDITFSTGLTRDQLDVFVMKFTGTITKEMDNSWAAGDNNGGLSSVDHPVTADTVYHTFALRKDSDGTIDFGWTEDVTGADLLSSTGVSGVYSNLRRIGSVITDGAGLIQEFIQDGDNFRWVATKYESDNNPGTAEVTWSLVDSASSDLAMPDGVRVEAMLSFAFYSDSNANNQYKEGGGDATLASATTSSADLRTRGDQRGGTVSGTYLTNVLGQVKSRQSNSSGSYTTMVAIHGWRDPRGRNF